jgi:hypothetical protein
MKTISKTRTQVAVVERTGRRGQMAPLHSRDEGELYQVLHGEVTFFIDGEVVPSEPCDVIVAPAGAQRTFRVDSDDARWIVSTRVNSLERYVDFGRAVAEPLSRFSRTWPSAEEQATVAAMAAANGIEVLGPPGDLPE